MPLHAPAQRLTPALLTGYVKILVRPRRVTSGATPPVDLATLPMVRPTHGRSRSDKTLGASSLLTNIVLPSPQTLGTQSSA
ncbi:hypothetical protein PSPO01_13915 [Paraphaeosphaeria sporulosa]